MGHQDEDGEKVGQMSLFRQHAASTYGFVLFLSFVCHVCAQKKLCVRSSGYIVVASPRVKICLSVRWVTLWVHDIMIYNVMTFVLIRYDVMT